ncbi:MBL fold metallo-hydrolase [Clostridium sp. C2-6-12]|uniref:MBL fold metallo-hydrolase n=1 Tax=Clostridium sp. C2-6-12 TaxID=2698832 RepID=UPI001369A505|nr:MBL fold metallo-hydrolase [Clostridium sp. C2-6-12]
MQITWYGNSCFLIKTTIGKRIILEPFNIITEYNSNLPKCDLIVTSRNYNNLSLSRQHDLTQLINETGTFDIFNLKIEGINSFQDNYNGLKRGPNIIYIIKDNEYSLCHLGNLGHIPSSLVLDKIKNIDILFVPIGGNFTLDGFNAAKLCTLIHPKYIIPMNYKTNNTSLFLDDPKNFIISMNHIKKINSNIINTSDFNLNYESECLLLSSP